MIKTYGNYLKSSAARQGFSFCKKDGLRKTYSLNQEILIRHTRGKRILFKKYNHRAFKSR